MRLLEALWRVADADAAMHKYEEHLIRRVADLLHVPHSGFIAAKLRATGPSRPGCSRGRRPAQHFLHESLRPRPSGRVRSSQEFRSLGHGTVPRSPPAQDRRPEPQGRVGQVDDRHEPGGVLRLDGPSVALMDHDPQGSSMRWLRLRPADLPAIHGIAAYEKKLGVTRAFALRTPPGTDTLVVDTPAAVTPLQLPELTQDAHAIVVPVLPSDIDIHAASRAIADLLLVGPRASVRAAAGHRGQPGAALHQGVQQR